MIKIIICLLFIIFIIYYMVSFKKSLNDNPLDNYKSEHINDFVNFAKTQLHLPKVQAIKAIRTEFPHLALVEAVKVYELAKMEESE